MLGRLAELVLRARGLVVAVLGAVTVLAGLGYARLQVENKLASWFPADDPELARYEDFRRRFGDEDAIFVVLRAPDIFARDVLALVDRLTRAIAELPAVARTTSLTSVEDIVGTAAGIEILPLVPRLDHDEPALQALRARILADPFFPGTIVSSDGRTTAIMAELRESTTASNHQAVEAIERVIAATTLPAGVELHVAGWPPANVVMDRLTNHDVTWNFPLALLVLSLCLAQFFRSIGAVAVIVLTVVVTITWTMGAFAGLGLQGTFVTVSALPGILLPLTIATTVHVLARFDEERAAEGDPREAMRRTLEAIALPVFLTSATTAVGFGSLAVSDIPPLRHLGLFAALGMAVALLLSLTLVPVVRAAVGRRSRPAPHPALERTLARVAAVGLAHPRAILAASLALGLLGAVGLARLEPQGSSLHYLPEGAPPFAAMRFIERHFGGASTIDVVVSGPPDVLKEPASAETVAAVQAVLRAHPTVFSAIAYTDLLRRMNRALRDGDPDAYRIPETRGAIAQELLLYELSGGTELSRMIDVTDYSAARVSGRMSSFLDAPELARLYGHLREQLAGLTATSGLGLRAELAGEGPLWFRQNSTLTAVMAESFLLALAGITAMMMLLAGSPTLGLVAMIPNVIPILLTVGLMGWIGIRLDFATVTIASVAIGIAVDDTIHFLSRYRAELAVVGDARHALVRAMTTVGKAMVATSAILCTGMLTLLTSSFPPHRTFGLMMAMTVVFALGGDLFLLPALLHLRARQPSGEQGSARAPASWSPLDRTR